MLKKAFSYIALGVVIIVTLALAACGSTSNEDNRHFTIGLATNNPNGLRNVQGFRDGMAELGYIEGEDVTYIFEGSPIKDDELDAITFIQSGEV